MTKSDPASPEVAFVERHRFPPELLKNIAPLGVLVEAVVASAS